MIFWRGECGQVPAVGHVAAGRDRYDGGLRDPGDLGAVRTRDAWSRAARYQGRDRFAEIPESPPGGAASFPADVFHP